MQPVDWLIFALLPFLYLPNLGTIQTTSYGTLQISDFLIFPFTFLVFVRGGIGKDELEKKATFIFSIFLYWALLVSLLIPWRYPTANFDIVVYSVLKLAKFALYGYSGLLVSRVVRRLENPLPFYWALLACGWVLGLSFLLFRAFDPNFYAIASAESADWAALGYQSSNEISVLMGMQAVFIAGLFVANVGTALWRKMAVATFVILLFGSAISFGRGGWIATLAGLLFLLFWKRGRWRVALTLAITGLAFWFGYDRLPEFRSQVDDILQPVQTPLAIPGLPLDDGGRIEIWLEEAPRLLDAPLMGTGFFHRGGASGLLSTGSHNFFLQIFLETGIPGGLVMILLFSTLWRQASSISAKRYGASIAVQGMLVVAITGGFGGEYFYGGLGIFTLFLLYASVGSLKKTDPSPKYVAVRRTTSLSARILQ